jgi:hypothetical protein
MALAFPFRRRASPYRQEQSSARREIVTAEGLRLTLTLASRGAVPGRSSSTCS